MPWSITFKVIEKYDFARKELGLRVAIAGFNAYKGLKIRFSAFPSIEKTFTKTGALTFEAIGTPGTNILEVIEPKSGRIIQAIGSVNSNLFTEGPTNQEIKITHYGQKAAITLTKVPKLKEEFIRLDASPKISLFFGVNPETKQPIYTKKVDKKGNFQETITGPLSEKHEVRVLTGQMVKIVSIKPPEP
ncbi:MAG: hypothetical protein ACTSXO_05565 [Candidatus Heimdallarchaeota archaeon]